MGHIVSFALFLVLVILAVVFRKVIFKSLKNTSESINSIDLESESVKPGTNRPADSAENKEEGKV